MLTPEAQAALRDIEGYVDSVLSDQIPAGRLIRLACERHRRDMESCAARGLWFDAETAARRIGFIENLKHYKGEWAGGNFRLQPWQKFCIGSIFGWRTTGERLRRFRTVYEEVPRKNGKSPKAAAVGLILLIDDGEPAAEVYSAATKKDQAKIVWNDARQFVLQSPALRKRVLPYRTSLAVPSTVSAFVPLGADADTQDGLSVHGSVIDELHKHKTRGLLDVIKTGTAARRQPLTFMITTAGEDKESVCGTEHDYAVDVLERTIDDDTLFAFIAAADEDDDWTQETTWRKANPNYGVSVKAEYLRAQCREAQDKPSAEPSFKRLHLGIWTHDAKRAIRMTDWNKGNAHFDPATLIGRECCGGMDLSSKLDLTSTALVFPPIPGDPDWYVLQQYWIPEENVQIRQAEARAPYERWIAEGYLQTTAGSAIHYARIEDWFREQRDIGYRIREIGYDSWNALQCAMNLQADEFQMVEVRQGGKSMGLACKEFESFVFGGRWRHNGHPVSRWNASNLVWKKDDNDNYKPDKRRSGGKIDGIVADINALARAIGTPPEEESVYETRGVETIAA